MDRLVDESGQLIRPGMGTENAFTLISSLIAMTRPRTVLEIGAGDSTVAISAALTAAAASADTDRLLIQNGARTERASLLQPAEASSAYSPKFVSVDDHSGEGSSAAAAWAKARELAEGAVELRVVERDVFSITDEEFDRWGPLDLIWIDVGTPTDDARLFSLLWPRLATGGLMVLHEPTVAAVHRDGPNETVGMVRTPLWEALAQWRDDEVEVLTIPERHKFRQSGIGILRRRALGARARTSPFQDEMWAIGEPPAKRPAVLERREKASKSLDEAAQDQSVRPVLGALLMGRRSASEIAQLCCLPPRDVGRALGRLTAWGVVINENGGFDLQSVDAAPSARTSRHDETWSLRRITSEDVLRRIVGEFRNGLDYDEVQVNAICTLFHEDFAAVRRALVDAGLLSRESGLYRRADDAPDQTRDEGA